MVVVLRQLIEEEGISPNAETNNHGRKLLHEVCFHTGHRAANGAASNLWGNKRVLPGPLDRHLKKVITAGGFTAYERAHRARLVAMLVPKLTHMPADAISHMVDFAFHVGFY